MHKANKSESSNTEKKNNNLVLPSKERSSDTEEVDLPPDFFDDFSNQEFLDGLEIIDEVCIDRTDYENSTELDENSSSGFQMNLTENSNSTTKQQQNLKVLDKSESVKRNNKLKWLANKRLSPNRIIYKAAIRLPNSNKINNIRKNRKIRNHVNSHRPYTSSAQKSRSKKKSFLEELEQTFAGKSFPELDAVKSQLLSGNMSLSKSMVPEMPFYSENYNQNNFYDNMQHYQKNVFISESTFPYSGESQMISSCYPVTVHSNSNNMYSFQQHLLSNAMEHQLDSSAHERSLRINHALNNTGIGRDVPEENISMCQENNNRLDNSTNLSRHPSINLAKTISRLQCKQESTITNEQLNKKRKVSSVFNDNNEDNNIQMNKPKQQKIGLAELLEASLTEQLFEKTNTKMTKVLNKVSYAIKHLKETQQSSYTPLTFDYTPKSSLLASNEKSNDNEGDYKSIIENTKTNHRFRKNIPLSFAAEGSSQHLINRDMSIDLAEKLCISINEINDWTREYKDTLLSVFDKNSNVESFQSMQKHNSSSNKCKSIATQTTPGHWMPGPKNLQFSQATQTVIGNRCHTDIIDSLSKLNVDQLNAVKEFICMIQWTEPSTSTQINNLHNRLISCYELARSGWRCPSHQNISSDRTNKNIDQNYTNFTTSLNNNKQNNITNSNTSNPMSIILKSLAYSSKTNSESTCETHKN